MDREIDTSPQQTTAAGGAASTPPRSKRVAIVGIGHRAGAWIGSAARDYAGQVRIVGLCDPVVKRCQDAVDHWKLPEARIFDNDRAMLAAVRPDLVVVCSPESVHRQHIVGALEAGCDVATEKPLCVSARDAAAILEAERRTGRRVRMGFNYRHIPLCSKVKQLVAGGAIGRPVCVDLTWYLDYHGHGASYFRRWHSEMAKSGGLLVTKATHHFDLVNWWVGDKPIRVYAECDRQFFGRENGPYEGTRCRECDHADECAMYRKMDAARQSAELGYKVRTVHDYDGDLCVYRRDIDIFDTHSVTVRYAQGCILHYTLVAGAPYEGWNLAINGTNGRIETGINDAKPQPGWQQDAVVMDRQNPAQTMDAGRYYVAQWPSHYKAHVMPLDRAAYQVEVENIIEGHGGGDPKIMGAAYADHDRRQPDPLGRFASAIDGARSLAIGAAANTSATEHRPVMIRDLLGPWA